MKKTFKKIAAVAMAAMMTLGCAMSTMAADEYTAEFGAQFNKDVNETVGEWPSFSDAKVTFTEGTEATFTYTFDENVQFAGNYVAINTNYPYSDDVVANITSVKVDGVAVTTADAYLNNEGTDGGLRLTLTNLWNSDITTQPMDASAVPAFKTIEIKFIVGDPVVDDTTSDDTTTDDTTSDDTTSDDTTSDDTTTDTTTTTTPDTGDSSMVAMYLVVALAAVAVVLKKRTATN